MNAHDLVAHGPVIPVIVLDRLDDAVPLAQALVAGGVRVLEVTLRTPVALKCIEAIAAACPTRSSAPARSAPWPTPRPPRTPAASSA